MRRSPYRGDESAFEGPDVVNLDVSTILRLTASADGAAGAADSVDADQEAKKPHVRSRNSRNDDCDDASTAQTLLATENPPLERGAHLNLNLKLNLNQNSTDAHLKQQQQQQQDAVFLAGNAMLFRPPERPDSLFYEDPATSAPAGDPSLIHGLEGVAMGMEERSRPVREDSSFHPGYLTFSPPTAPDSHRPSLLVADLVPPEEDPRNQNLNDAVVSALSVQPMQDPVIVRRRRCFLGAVAVLAFVGTGGAVAGIYGRSPAAQIISTPSPSGSKSPSLEPSLPPSSSTLPSIEPTLVPSVSISPTSILERVASVLMLDQNVPAEGTPQFNSLLWLSESQELSSYSSDELRARYALATLVLTSSTIPPPLSEDSHCTWSGIACNGLLQVTAINATTLDLTAFHFPPELALLSDSLTSVVYDGSQYEGSLPTELGRLAELTDLSLSSRGLNGTLPSELGMLSTLQVLHISRSSLTGTLPTQFGLLTNLRSLDLSQNDFSSVIPTEMGQLTPLMRLDISDNSLSGGFPNQLTRLSNLVVLNVGNNNLNQALLNNTFDTYTNLETLDLSQNGLAFYSFEYSGIQGFPSLLLNTALTYLDVSSNLFTATIPSTIQYLTNLVHLNMSKGTFKGELPAFLGLLTKLTSIDLSTNTLESWDSMIFNLSNLASLEFFDLTDNCVRAVLPCDFFPSSITANKTIHVDRDYVNCTGDCCAPAVYINRYLGVCNELQAGAINVGGKCENKKVL